MKINLVDLEVSMEKLSFLGPKAGHVGGWRKFSRLFLWGGMILGTRQALCATTRSTEPCWDCYRIYAQGLLEDYAGRAVEAMGAYQEVLRRDPEAGMVNDALVGAAMIAGRVDVALEAAQKSVALFPKNAEAHMILGRVYLARGENELAKASFEKALALDPSNIEILNLAVSRRAIENPQTDRNLYEQFLSAHPNDDRIRFNVAGIQRRQGDVEAALESYRRLLASDPSNSEAQLGLAGAYDLKGDTVAAIAAYETFLESHPDHFEVLSRLGQQYYASGRQERAGDFFDRALRLDPENSGLHFWRGLVAAEQGDWDRAVRHMRQTAKDNSEPGVLLRLASYEAQRGNSQEALRLLKRLQKKNPHNPDFMYSLALAYEDFEKPRPAIVWLNRALARAPNKAEIYFHLALNWDKRKNFSRAQTYLERVLELDPDHPLALNYWGYSWVEKNQRLPEALERIERAVALDPENPAYRDSLGWAYYRLGRLAEAETALKGAAPLANDPVVWSHYGDTLLALERSAEAVRAWQEGLLLDPDDRPLLKRLAGVKESGPHTLLKRAQGHLRRLSSLSGLAEATVRSDGRAVTGRALFYYVQPGGFRLEVLGPLYVPRAVLVYNNGTFQGPGGPLSGRQAAWFSLWADVLSGKFFQKFDGPAVRVRQEKNRVVYSTPEAEVFLSSKDARLEEARLLRPNGGAPVGLRFGSYQRKDGIFLPRSIEGDSAEGSFVLTFSRWTVNPRLNPSLFVPTP